MRSCAAELIAGFHIECVGVRTRVDNQRPAIDPEFKAQRVVVPVSAAAFHSKIPGIDKNMGFIAPQNVEAAIRESSRGQARPFSAQHLELLKSLSAEEPECIL